MARFTEVCWGLKNFWFICQSVVVICSVVIFTSYIVIFTTWAGSGGRFSKVQLFPFFGGAAPNLSKMVTPATLPSLIMVAGQRVAWEVPHVATPPLRQARLDAVSGNNLMGTKITDPHVSTWSYPHIFNFSDFSPEIPSPTPSPPQDFKIFHASLISLGHRTRKEAPTQATMKPWMSICNKLDLSKSKPSPNGIFMGAKRGM